MNRRKFIQLGLAGSATLVTHSLFYPRSSEVELLGCPTQKDTFKSTKNPIFTSYSPELQRQPELIQYLPQLSPMSSTIGMKIANALTPLPFDYEELNREGIPGNAIFWHPNYPGQNFIPWVSLFPSQASINPAPTTLSQLINCRLIVIKDDGSTTYPIYGNKARKYQYLLPNLSWSRSKNLLITGALGSNHALQFAIANRLSKVSPNGNPLALPLELALYDQHPNPDSCLKFAVMRRMGASITELKNDFETGTAIAGGYLRERSFVAPGQFALIPPGGSNPISVLAHIDALIEVNSAIQKGDSVLDSPPDYLFVALGSASTSLGLLLGTYLLGWSTRIVVTPSQDKNWLTRLIANRQPQLPFGLGNLYHLGETTLAWLKRNGFPVTFPTIETLIESRLEIDNNAWLPGYGTMSKTAQYLYDTALNENLLLDNTFTIKTLQALVDRSKQGVLKEKTVLFWNSYNRFDYSQLLS